MSRILRRRFVDPVAALLRQGLTPEKLALSLALGAALGVFPVLGATTPLCLAAGAALRLSHPALQLANYAVYPLQLVLILAFVRVGERVLGAAPVALSVERMIAFFRADPLGFLARFGLTGVHGVLGWSLLAPLAGAALYFLLLAPLRFTAGRMGGCSQAAS